MMMMKDVRIAWDVPSTMPVKRRERRSILFREKKPPNLQNSSSFGNQILQEISIPGLHKVIAQRRPLWHRGAWALLITICLAVSTYQISDRIRLFCKNERIFQSEIHLINKMYLPALTICVDPTYSLRFLPEYVTKYLETYSHCPRSTLELVGLFGITVEDIWKTWNASAVVKYQLNRVITVRKEEKQLITKSVLTPFGHCVTAIIRNEVYYREGRGFEWAALIPMNRNLSCRSIPYIGFLIHPLSEPLEHVILQRMIYHAMYANVQVDISPKKVILLNTTDNPCYDEVTFYNCLNQCLEKKLGDGMTCRLPYMEPSDVPLCKSAQSTEEAFNRADQIYNVDGAFCQEQCHRKCVNEYFSTTINVATAPAEDFVYLYIHFKDNVYEIVQETIRYSLINCLCDIGGNLGLFLGISLLHLLEILDNLLSFCNQKFRKK